VAYRLNCDVEACGAEIESGPGRPGLVAAPLIYCNRCSAYVEAVEAELHRENVKIAMQGVEQLRARRQELMAAMLPKELGGDGRGMPTGVTVG
jgi:hypothetical protein